MHAAWPVSSRQAAPPSSRQQVFGGGCRLWRGEGEALPQGVEFAAQAKPEPDRGAAAPAN